jgi:hypothetical protein
MEGPEYIVLNEGLELRERNGKQRFTVKVTAEPIVHQFDAYLLGKGPAEAIAEHFRQKIRGIGEKASAATLRARAGFARGVAAGKAWALKRYAGGRTGVTPPNESDRLFNDSGRLASSITANANKDGDTWRINVAANRLDPATANRGGIAAVEQIFSRLVELVPEFGDSSLLATALPIRKAIQDSAKQLLAKARATKSQLDIQLAKQIFARAKQAASIFAA